MTSIRRYLAAVLLSIICLANFLAALHGYRMSMKQAEQISDQQLKTGANLLNKLTHKNANIPNDLLPDTIFFQIWQNNQLLHKSHNAPNQKILTEESGFHIVSLKSFRWRTFVQLDSQHHLMIIIGQRRDVFADLVESMILESVFPVIWILPLLGLLIWLIISYGLKPLDQLASILHRRKADNFSALELNQYPVELTVVVESINQLFKRLNAAFEREKRFAADAAHELRTPLSVLKLNIHNLIEDIGENHPEIKELEKSVQRMQHSIEQILSLYKLTNESFQNAINPIDLKEQAKAVIVKLYQICQIKHQRIELNAENIFIEGNEFAIQTLLSNIIDNACKYSPENGEISITITRDQTNAKILVEDSGPGIPKAQQKRVFDRFYRADGDRHASTVLGCGLGLSIVEYIVQLHHGVIYLSQSQQLGGLAVHIILPMRYSKEN